MYQHHLLNINHYTTYMFHLLYRIYNFKQQNLLKLQCNYFKQLYNQKLLFFLKHYNLLPFFLLFTHKLYLFNLLVLDNIYNHQHYMVYINLFKQNPLYIQYIIVVLMRFIFYCKINILTFFKYQPPLTHQLLK